MTTLPITILATFLLSTTVWADPATQSTETNSFYKAVLEVGAMDNNSQKNVIPATPYTHENQKNNSLFRAALAKQGVNVNLRINSASEVSYVRSSNTSEQYNSLSHGALAK